MILTVEELKKYITTDKEDTELEAKLQALESLIRKYTNNNFQKRSIRVQCQIMSQKLYTAYPYIVAGDTVEISQSIYNNGVYTVEAVENGFMELNKPLLEESEVLVTKIEYPTDVKMGVVELIKWDLGTGSKVGIQSETISRHSVTYVDTSGANFYMGYPKSKLGFLSHYKKARF